MKLTLHTVTITVKDTEDGHLLITTKTKPEVSLRVPGVSPAVDLTMWIQQLIIAKLKGKPHGK